MTEERERGRGRRREKRIAHDVKQSAFSLSLPLALPTHSFASNRVGCSRDHPLFLTSAAGFLREKVRRASLGVEKDGAAFAFCAAAFVAVGGACLLLAGAASFSLLCVSSSGAATDVAAAARPRRGGMVGRAPSWRGERARREEERERLRSVPLFRFFPVFVLAHNFAKFEEEKRGSPFLLERALNTYARSSSLCRRAHLSEACPR